MRAGTARSGTSWWHLLHNAGKPAGSSPQARGRGYGDGDPWRSVGFIPAGAGERVLPPGGRSACRVHPRRRGGEVGTDFVGAYTRGSSPQARGRVQEGARGVGQAGFIPAGAGESRGHHRREGGPGVHPRRRGGEVSVWAEKTPAQGSSPQARGRDYRCTCGRRLQGFIPAGAGERNPRSRSHRLGRVHPRRRGGEQAPAEHASACPGSSPQARGRVRERLGARVDRGFIPAGAGESARHVAKPSFPGVHPRRRGGEACATGATPLTRGSSPQARGRGQLVAGAGRCLGFIPAGAGERGGLPAKERRVRVHPRRRGGESESRR